MHGRRIPLVNLCNVGVVMHAQVSAAEKDAPIAAYLAQLSRSCQFLQTSRHTLRPPTAKNTCTFCGA